MYMKYIIVSGGVISGLGKGITASSIGRLLKSRGLSVTAIKIDPYLNFDAGTLNPFEHGEVFVLDDGGEVDLDLGHYERFLDISLTRDHNITTGKIYGSVIEKERIGHFLGKTVQIIPHITNEIKDRIRSVAHKSGSEICMIELGGTVGDIESMPYLEAMRQLHAEVGDENCIFVHTTLIPVVSAVGEQKTKPTQHSVKELRALGIQPDIIVSRSESALDISTKKKISLFCDVPLEAVISAPNAKTIYEVPVLFEEQGLTNYLLNKMKSSPPDGGLGEWKDFLSRVKSPTRCVEICLVGKYMDLMDSYISHFEALKHAGAELDTAVKFRCIEAEDIEEAGNTKCLEGVNGVLIPGGFGQRGIEGKISAARFARENDVPFLGVCLGFQIASIEFSRNVLCLSGANSTEFDPNTPHPVVDMLPEQGHRQEGGHDAPGRATRDGSARDHGLQALRRRGDIGAAPPQIRDQSRIHREDRGGRDEIHRPIAGRSQDGDTGDSREKLLCRLSVPSGVQVPPAETFPPTLRPRGGCFSTRE